MDDLKFKREHVLEAIQQVRANGRNWLLETARGHGGGKARLGKHFLVFEGEPYPVKALSRLANKLAGGNALSRAHTHATVPYFNELGFETRVGKEAAVNKRLRRLSSVLARDEQAKFRKKVFEYYGARCLVTGADSLIVLEAAHIIPVSKDGPDEAHNGLPLRADIHRLFDANLMQINPETFTLSVLEEAGKYYEKFHGMHLAHLQRYASPKTVRRLQKRLAGR